MKLGLDVGYGDVKVVYQYEGRFSMRKFPTAVAYAERGVGELSEFAEEEEYEYRGRRYFVGERAMFGAFSTRSFEFMKRYSPLFVFKTVKDLQEKTGETVTDIALGLPLSHYTEANIKDLTPSLERIAVGQTVQELQVRFYPQGLGVLADYRLSEEGSVNRQTDEDLLIIDIGFNTVDVVVAEQGKIIKGDSETLERYGVAKIALALTKEVKSQMQIDLSEQEAKDVLCRGKIRLYGAERDLTELIREAAENYADWLMQEVRSKWVARIQRAERIIVAGGGAYYLKDHIPAEYRSITDIPDHPEYANARGFLKALGLEAQP